MTVLSLSASGQQQQPVDVLIIDGFNNHDWKQTTAVTKWILEKSGKFKVSVFTLPEDTVVQQSTFPDFNKYAVIIQNTNNIWKPHIRWPEHMERALEEYVSCGGGLYILHSANNAFSHWKEYDKMIGLGWRPQSFGYALELDSDKNSIRYAPGEGKGTGHADRFDAVIEIVTRHPVNEGYSLKWKTANTEVYYYPRGVAENITILSCAYDSTGTKKIWPVEWVVRYGRGRVYNSSMGHLWEGEIYPPAYRCAGFQTTMIRVTEWLATGKVTYPIPADFPGEDSTSLRDEHAFIRKE